MIERLRVRIPAGAAGEFSSPESTFYADLFVVCSTPVLPQWHVKDPGHSAKSADGRLHLNTHTPLSPQSQSELAVPLSRHSVGTYPETSLSGNFRPQSSQFTEPLWTDPGIKSRISVRELISTSKKEEKKKKKKKVQAGNE